MLVKIRSSQIHHFVQQTVDAAGKEADKDVLQFDVQFPEYPELPTYVLTVDFPITKEKVMAAVRTLAEQVKTQMAKDAAVREQLEEVLEFDVKV
jgi:hypothetical protein